MARLICDHISSDPVDRWLPVTSGKTSRQKAQRAFAAEFLCPIDGVTHFLGHDFSDEAIGDVAAYFSVDPRAIQNQLVNNHIVPRDLFFDIDGPSFFPYR
jgi:hypothetical protein